MDGLISCGAACLDLRQTVSNADQMVGAGQSTGPLKEGHPGARVTSSKGASNQITRLIVSSR